MLEHIESVLQDLEKLQSQGNKFWNISREVGEFLNRLIKLLNAQSVLEIGTSNGYSGIFLAEALTHTAGHLYTIESHSTRFTQAQTNFARANLKNITQIQGPRPRSLHPTDY